MGSEVDVDQSMNSMSAFNDGYKSLNIIANGHIELDTNVDNISDSGTDSFSEQMVCTLDKCINSTYAGRQCRLWATAGIYIKI